MTAIDFLDWTDLGLAAWLFISAVIFFRPANGSRPLLIGFSASALFALILTISRVSISHDPYRPLLAVLIFFWMGVKLWAIYAVYTGHRRPFRWLVIQGWKRLTNATDNPDLR